MAKRKNASQSRPKEDNIAAIPLATPSRWGPDPSRETLLDIAEKRGLLRDDTAGTKQVESQSSDVQDKNLEGSEDFEVIPRWAEALMWSTTLTMVHFTLDVLVQHQYAQDFSWVEVAVRTLQSSPMMFLIIYILHPHPRATNLLPGFPKLDPMVHQFLFFIGSVTAGCYLIYISNVFGYLAIMKRAPPVGCMWIWAVIELNLPTAVLSLACSGAYMWWNGFGYA